MIITLKVILGITAICGAVWSVIPLAGRPQATTQNITRKQRSFFACEILGLIFMIVVAALAFICLCAYEKDEAIAIACIVFSVVATIFFIGAISCQAAYNRWFGKHHMAETAWEFGALITAFYCFLESIALVAEIRDYGE
ncbi:unnamed protein product [Calicophoron daubneyi]|uniref:MARVEL domain-containing protein n=1 Tax=Calicophoron daubneyi TaxID=300641 RepID=A0AAV2TBM5_CALDB